MTKLSLTMTAALLTMTLAPAAQAYGTDPEPDTRIALTDLRLAAQDTHPNDVSCAFRVTAELAEILGLPDDWRTPDNGQDMAVACIGEN